MAVENFIMIFPIIDFFKVFKNLLIFWACYVRALSAFNKKNIQVSKYFS